MRPTIRIEGTDEIRRKLLAMGSALRRETLVPIIEDDLQPMVDDMKAHARRRSGKMANSIVASPTLSPRQAALNEPIAEIEVYAGPGPYPEAVQEEFGNFRQAPHPFIRPAFDRNVRDALHDVAADGVDAIFAAAKKG